MRNFILTLSLLFSFIFMAQASNNTVYSDVSMLASHLNYDEVVIDEEEDGCDIYIYIYIYINEYEFIYVEIGSDYIYIETVEYIEIIIIC